ncbi:hypothetical protein AB0L65_10065 [Nonomuraea sp. NPDC052116]|uniref:hypothetical protein n=1 Tax=Nonomuraea sp. NPDC052116 TaxID=3155665 RepID=UPI00342C4A19
MDPHVTPQQLGSDDAPPPKGTDRVDSSPSRRRPSPEAWQASSLLALINGVMVAVGGVFVTTSSLVITVIASVVALLIALMILVKN